MGAAEAAKRLGVFATQAAAGRSDLRSVEGDLAASVVDLQLVREQARLFGTGPGRGAPEPAESPYKGLASFDVGDAEWFYGRERLVAELIARLAGAPLLGVVGPSGSGKSSAVRAGLVPSMQAGVLPRSDEWIVVLMRPGEHPLRELDRALWSTLPERIRKELGGEDRPLRAARDVLGAHERLVLVIDQFEEVFTLCVDEDERDAFLGAVVEAARDPRANEIMVLALRADFYGRCAANPELAELLGANHVLVGPMTAEEYRRAIEQPALHAGVRIEPALVDELVGEVLGEPGALPLLSTALLELWERRDGRTIRAGEHAATGGVRGAVARLAEETYAGLSDEQQPIVRSVILRLAVPGEGESVVRRRVQLSEFDAERNEDVARVLDVLADRRLLTVSEGTVEVAHEALLREWPRFREWLEEDREGRRLHAHLTSSAREWSERGRDAAELYRGARLSSALDWTTEHTLELNELEREFVGTSRAASQLESERQQRTNRRLRMLLAGVGVLLALAVVAGAVALAQRASARREARVALARELGAEAVAEPRIDRAMLLARESVRLDRSLSTEGTLLATLLRSPAALATFTVPIHVRPLKVSLSPDGRRLVVADNDNELLFYDARTHRPVRAPLKNHGGPFPVVYTPDRKYMLAGGGDPREPPGTDLLDADTYRVVRHLSLAPDKQWLTTPTGNYEGLLVTPDGRTVLYGYYVLRGQQNGPAYLDRWDLATGKFLGITPLKTIGLSGFELTNGGRRLVAVGDSNVTTWDVRTLRELHSVPFHVAGRPNSGAVAPDGTVAAIGTSDGSVFLLDLRTGRLTQTNGGHQGAVQPMDFSPDGRTLVSTGEDGNVILWDAASGTRIETLSGHGARLVGLTFGADGTTLYTCSLDGAIFEWDLGVSRRFGKPFATMPAFDASELGRDAQGTPLLAVSPDGSRFAVRVGTSSVGLYSTRTAQRQSDFAVQGGVIGMAWSRTGELAVTGDSGHVQLWDVQRRPRLIRDLKGLRSTNGQPEAVTSVAFSSDGRLVAAGDVNHTSPAIPYRFGTVAVWEAASGKLLWKARTREGTVTSLAFSPDGETVVVARETGTVLWQGAQTGRVERKQNVQGGATVVVFAPGGTLATGSWPGIVELWNSETGAQIGHSTLVAAAPVASISFSPGGDLFATAGGSDGLAKIWSTKTQQQFGATFPGDPGFWGNAAYVPDGSKLIVVYQDGKGFVWPTSLNDLEKHACAVAGRNFTREEWSRYVTGRSYSKVCS
jgi:WD40 repeat protein